jgi:hypothetical protein
MRATRRIIFAVFCIVQLSSCSDFARWLRQYTYPPDFRYIERDQLRTAMGQLARQVREIDEHMQAPVEPEQLRKDILEHLAAMEAAARNLNATGWPSNHERIDINLARFQRDIKLAREAVERDPPNYTLTYSVTGACVYCHDRR